MHRNERRVELLIGRRIVDVNGDLIGRLEEIVAELVDDEYRIREYHVGAFAAFERVGAGMLGRSLLRLIGGGRVYDGYVIPWDRMDLTDAERPRTTVAKSELRRIDVPPTASTGTPRPGKSRSRRSA
jgi:hypothetical protein